MRPTSQIQRTRRWRFSFIPEVSGAGSLIWSVGPRRTMSVYYYISRNSGPFAKEGRREITEAEWRAAVAAVSDLAIEQPEESGPRGAACGVWAVWHSYPGGYPAWFGLLNMGGVDALRAMSHPPRWAT